MSKPHVIRDRVISSDLVLGCIVAFCMRTTSGFLLDSRLRCSPAIIRSRDLASLANIPTIRFEVSEFCPQSTFRWTRRYERDSYIEALRKNAGFHHFRASLCLRGGRNEESFASSNAPSSKPPVLTLEIIPKQIRYLLSLGVGNILYFLLYSAMMAHATNRTERTWCMIVSYGGKCARLWLPFSSF
jgi:hypothetical protein